ncbi:MAG: TIGR00366 family protein [Vicinamibacteria bacterium]|nr:TIGR00366 family protein [Vicinamibacteria bacterium]
MLSRLVDALARASLRYVPDAWSIAALLTLVAFAAAFATGVSPGAALAAWGGGFWELLGFSMQMVVVIFAGHVLAVSPQVMRLLEALAGVPRSPRQAVAWTALLSMALCWLNWGLGLIAAAMLVRFVARRHPDADYRLLVAVAYVGMGTTWHAGPSGSVPLLMATPGNFMVKGGLLAAPVPLAETVFTAANLGLVALLVVVVAALSPLLHPPAAAVVRATPEALAGLGGFAPPPRPVVMTPAEQLLHGGILNRVVGGLGVAYVVQQAAGGTLALTLDTVNLLFLSLAVALHPSPASLMRAGEEAARSLHGVILQFPLYAGIYGLMKGTGLATLIAQGFLAVATPATFPLVVFVYSAVLNYFVPSGGGKWAIEAPYVLGAANTLGVTPAASAMAYAYGDMATNLIQPFWAIPLLAVAKLEFRDILAFELLIFGLYSLLVAGFLLLA